MRSTSNAADRRDDRELTVVAPGKPDHVVPLWSREVFEQLSRIWLKRGWHIKHAYSFIWFGPVIQAT